MGFHWRRRYALAVLLLSASACSPGAAAEALRPSDPTYEQAVGESSRCEGIGQTAEPLLVDVRPEFRGDVEVAMRQGVAVVRYDCGGLRLLKDCSVEGSYGYLPTVTKRQAVQLANADEIRANLPVQGAGIAAELAAELRRGASLDVALVMVGKRSTTRTRVLREDLAGSCKGATHFVHRATVGAFAMNVGTRAQVRSVAQVFAAGVRAESSTRKTIRNQDGDPDTCDDATTNDATPPDQCSALLRLELVAIARDDGSEPADAVVRSIPCPKGYAMAGGKCTRTGCVFGKLPDCARRCRADDATACNELGFMFATGTGTAKNDARAVEWFKRSCSLNSSEGCSNLGFMYDEARGVARDEVRARELYERACLEGEAGACYNRGVLPSGENISWLQRACDGGVPASCSALGDKYVNGGEVERNAAKALSLYTRACDGGDRRACRVSAPHAGAPGQVPTKGRTAEEP
jgi:hypothetical protein